MNGYSPELLVVIVRLVLDGETATKNNNKLRLY
jgi:hypothetical protein